MNARSFVLLCAVFLIACSKKETPQDVPCTPIMPSPYRVATESIYSGPDTTFVQTTTFRYDSARRLIYRITTHGGLTDTTEQYTYYQDKVRVNAVTYLLNDDGLAKSLESFYAWDYNADGYLIQQNVTYAGGASASFYTYNCFNLNRVIMNYHTSAGAFTDTVYYEYYPDKINTIGNHNHGIFFLGRQDNTLRKAEISHGVVRNPVTYVFDSEHRVSWKTETDSQGHVVYIKYTYL